MADFDTGGAVGGATAGATTGGMIGGPIGAGIGGVAGGLIGGFGLMGSSEEERRQAALNNEFRAIGEGDFLAQGLQNIQGARGDLGRNLMRIGAPQAQSFTAQSPEQRAMLLQGLQNQFMGQGPGQEIARRQAAQAALQGGQQQMSMAAGQRGNPGAARLAAQNMANISGGAANAATMGGLQAQIAAVNPLLAGLSQEQQMRQFNAQQQQQGSQFNVGATLQNRAQQQQAGLEALRQQIAAAQLVQQGKQAYQGARTQRFGAIAGAPMGTTRAQEMLALGTGALEGYAGLQRAGAFGSGGGGMAPTGPGTYAGGTTGVMIPGKTV